MSARAAAARLEHLADPDAERVALRERRRRVSATVAERGFEQQVLELWGGLQGSMGSDCAIVLPSRNRSGVLARHACPPDPMTSRAASFM